MNAQDIVSAILEAEPSRMSGALFYFDGMDASGFYVASPEDGDVFTKIVDTIGELYPSIAPQSELRKDTDAVLSAMMDQFNLVIVLSFDQDIAVYSQTAKPTLPAAFKSKLKSYFSIDPKTPVAWFSEPSSDDPMMTFANSIIYGEAGLLQPPAKGEEHEKELPLASVIGAQQPKDLASKPWNLKNIPGPRSQVRPMSRADRDQFRKRFWYGRQPAKTGDIEKLWGED